jgi:3-hydroxy-9,10-secoandrosta-1,3,5(10)-triene-9,17-dione monooxygenase
VPRSDYRIDDNWFVSGMCGTGSKDIVIDEAFIPAHRALAADHAGVDDWTGWETHARPSYHVPMRVFMGWDLVSPIIGIAQGAVDEFASRLVGTSGPGRTADSVAAQLRLAESSAEVDSARVLHRHCIQDILAKGAHDEPFTPLDRARYQRDKAYVTRLCVQAVNRLFEAAGGHALFAPNPMQRIHRDVHAASHQAALSWDTAAENYGRLILTPG